MSQIGTKFTPTTQQVPRYQKPEYFFIFFYGVLNGGGTVAFPARRRKRAHRMGPQDPVAAF